MRMKQDEENMTIRCTCGHEVEYFSDSHNVTLPSYNIDFDLDGMVRCVTYLSLCNKCYDGWRKYNLVTKIMVDDWLEGRVDYDRTW